MTKKNFAALALLLGLGLVGAFSPPAHAITDSMKIERGNGNIRKFIGRVTVSGGVPAIAAGSGFTLVDTAPGEVQVVLTRPGRKFMSINAVPLESSTSGAHTVKVISVTQASSVIFGIYASGGGTAQRVGGASTSFASPLTVGTSMAQIKLAVDTAIEALKTDINAYKNGTLVDNVGFLFEITVQD